MPIRTWVRHIAAQVAGSSLIVLISGAWVRIIAPVARIRLVASTARADPSSRGWEKCAMNASDRPEATTCSNRRSVSSASGSDTNRCGQ